MHSHHRGHIILYICYPWLSIHIYRSVTMISHLSQITIYRKSYFHSSFVWLFVMIYSSQNCWENLKALAIYGDINGFFKGHQGNPSIDSIDVDDYRLIIYSNRLSGYGSIPINTIFRGMNIHLPAILMFTRGTRF